MGARIDTESMTERILEIRTEIINLTRELNYLRHRRRQIENSRAQARKGD